LVTKRIKKLSGIDKKESKWVKRTIGSAFPKPVRLWTVLKCNQPLTNGCSGQLTSREPAPLGGEDVFQINSELREKKLYHTRAYPNGTARIHPSYIFILHEMQ